MATFMLELYPITSSGEPVVDLARRAAALESDLRQLLASVGATDVIVSWAHEEGETTAVVQYDSSHLVDAAVRCSLSSSDSPLALRCGYRLFTAYDFAAHMEVAHPVAVG